MKEPQVFTELAVIDGQPFITTVVNGQAYIVGGVVAPETQLPLNINGDAVECEELGQMVCHSDGKLYVVCEDVNQLVSDDAALVFMKLEGCSTEGLKSDFWGSRPPRIPNGN